MRKILFIMTVLYCLNYSVGSSHGGPGVVKQCSKPGTPKKPVIIKTVNK